MARNFEKVIIDYAEAKNVENSSCDRNGSWIQNWEQVTGRRARKCSFFGCGRDSRCRRTASAPALAGRWEAAGRRTRPRRTPR